MAITRIQAAPFVHGTSVSSVNTLFSSAAVSSGNAIAMAYGMVFVDTVDVVDNVNGGVYTLPTLSTRGSRRMGIGYKLGISSGAAISTYRVSFNGSSIGQIGIGAVEYAGITSTISGVSSQSAAAASSSPTADAATSTDASVLFFAAATKAGTSTQWRSTMGNGFTLVGSINEGSTAGPNSTYGALAIGELITSSLTEAAIFRIAPSTLWQACQITLPASTTVAVDTPGSCLLPLLGIQALVGAIRLSPWLGWQSRSLDAGGQHG